MIDEAEAERKRVEALNDLHQKNQEFLDKAIFSVSIIAIGFLFNAINDTDKERFSCYTEFFSVLLLFFSIVIILHVISYKITTVACNNLTKKDDGDKIKQGKKQLKYAGIIDSVRDYLFILSIFLIAMLVMITNF